MSIIERFVRMDKAEKSGIINMIIKPMSVIAGLVYTPLLLSYLGEEKYGLWATILSFISWINYFDVGIGNGLRNVLTTCLAQKEYKKTKKAISTAYIVLSLISMFIFVVITILVLLLNWSVVFSTKIDMRTTLFVTGFFICINFVLALANTILYALQLSERIAIRNFLVQCINIVGIIGISKISSGNLVHIAILFGASQLIINVGNTVSVMKNNQNLRPSIKEYDKTTLSSICNVGIKFFIIQLMCLLMFTVDDLLVTHYWGATQNTSFSIVNKVFNTVYTFFAAFMVPYWSGTTEALTTNNNNWIRKSLWKSIQVLGVFMLGYIILAFAFDDLVYIWLGEKLIYQTTLVPLMCLFYILYSVLNVESQFINGTGYIDLQMILYIVLGIANVPFSIFLGVHYGLGPVGIRLATTILVCIADVVLAFNLKIILRKVLR